MKLFTRFVPALALGLIVTASASAQTAPAAGAVFAMTNDATANEIAVFERDSSGMLSAVHKVATTGMGTGADLNSQNSLVLSPNREWLIAVNAGSDEITIFQVNGSNLQLTDKVSSGGNKPVSLAVRKDVLYVLNGGNPNNVTGFTIGTGGLLTPIPLSERPLSAAITQPAMVGWHPNGELIIVTEKATDLVDTFAFDNNTSTLGTFQTLASSGPDPFGFAFHGNRQMLVAESNGGLTDAGTVSTYGFQQNVLVPAVVALPTTETSSSWIVATPNKKWVYVSNTDSDSISGLHNGATGLELIDPTGVSATTGDGPTDLALMRNKFLYALNSLEGSISAYSITAADGSLVQLHPPVTGLPTVGAAGLAAN